MPNASEPKAPCVEVWLSPQTMVIPGWGDAQLRGRSRGRCPGGRSRGCRASGSRTPRSFAPGFRPGRGRARRRSGGPAIVPSVGVLWSAVASVLSGRRTGRLGQAEAVEGLRRGDLVDQVQVDVDQSLADLMLPPRSFRTCSFGIAVLSSSLSPAAITAMEAGRVVSFVLEVVRKIGVEGDGVPLMKLVAARLR